MRHSLPVPFVPTSFSGPTVPGERNDCSVRALMTVTGRTYMESHALHAGSLGRRTGKATRTYGLVKALDAGEVLGVKLSRTHGQGFSHSGRVTLARFCAENPRGRFYCLIRGHAFAVVDGALVDTWRVRPGSLIWAAWRAETSPAALPAVQEAPAAPEASLPKAQKYDAPSKAWRASLDAALRALPAECRSDVSTALAYLVISFPQGSDVRHEVRCGLRRTA